jgi:hypothetical protein
VPAPATTRPSVAPVAGALDDTPAVGALLQQLLATMTQLDTRMGMLEAARCGGSSGDTAAAGEGFTVPSPAPVPGGSGDDSDGGDEGDDGDSGDDGSGDNDESSSGSDRARRATGGIRAERRRRRRGRRSNIKDLELPTFTTSPKVSVSTWIDRVDLVLKGARSSGRGRWSDADLYFILRNKLMESASRWWVTMNRKLTRAERTWTTLKTALLRRYGERLDISAAEGRVNQRQMMPGETYADFAAGLRDATGRNLVEERVLLPLFKPDRQAVGKQREPATLERAVDFATEIDDTNANVAQGMQNIGQPWATAPSPYLIFMTGTTGQTMVIPGIGGTGLPLEALIAAHMTTTGGEGAVALFTNPQGVWNKFSGTWDVPKGRQWNGKFWAETASKKERRPAPESTARRGTGSTAGQAAKKAKVMLTAVPELSSDGDDEEDDSEAGPSPPKKAKRKRGSVKQAAASEPRNENTKKRAEWRNGGPGRFREELRCYACGNPGHFADRCPDPVAKARNDAYLASRRPASKPAESEERE